MAQAGASISALRASGGGARDELWPGIVRDVTGLPQRRLNAGTGMATGAAAGSALLAAIALGEADLETSWARPEELRPPAPETSPLYDELYGLYRELYPATREQAHALARLQRRGDVPGGGAG
jgi:xylulokinase